MSVKELIIDYLRVTFKDDMLRLEDKDDPRDWWLELDCNEAHLLMLYLQEHLGYVGYPVVAINEQTK